MYNYLVQIYKAEYGLSEHTNMYPHTTIHHTLIYTSDTQPTKSNSLPALAKGKKIYYKKFN